jgi:STE24 endopeptidase
MQYEKAKHKFSNISWLFTFIIMLLVLIFKGFWFLDNFVRQFSENQIVLALMFFWIIVIIQTIISLPFSYYSTFIIEKTFGTKSLI